jgi:hypothetical protein
VGGEINNNMLRKYKYDVAISVAEEDLAVAEQIAQALKKRAITYYLYTEHQASNWGQHILKISQGIYGAEARYVLMLTSKIFVEKYWAGIENQVSQIFATGKEVYILQLRLDDTMVDGLSRHKVFVDWKGDAEEVGEMIKVKIEENKNSAPRLGTHKRIAFRATAAAFLLLLITILLLQNISQRNKNTPLGKREQDNKSLSDTPVIKPEDTLTENGKKPKEPVKTLPSINKPVAKNSEGNQELPVINIQDAKINEIYDYWVQVNGNNESLDRLIESAVGNEILSKGMTLTKKETKAKKKLQLTFNENTVAGSQRDKDLISCVCNYQYSITGQNGNILASFEDVLKKPGFNTESIYHYLTLEIINQLKAAL